MYRKASSGSVKVGSVGPPDSYRFSAVFDRQRTRIKTLTHMGEGGDARWYTPRDIRKSEGEILIPRAIVVLVRVGLGARFPTTRRHVFLFNVMFIYFFLDVPGALGRKFSYGSMFLSWCEKRRKTHPPSQG